MNGSVFLRLGVRQFMLYRRGSCCDTEFRSYTVGVEADYKSCPYNTRGPLLARLKCSEFLRLHFKNNNRHGGGTVDFNDTLHF